MNNPVVLVVDDDDAVRQLLASALARSGFSVLAAASGPKALKLFGQSVDLVLSDIVMPGMDGIALAAEIRKLLPRVPIVLMSGWVSNLDPAVAPLYQFVRKPLNLHSLIGVIRDELRRMPRPAQSEAAGAGTQDAAKRRACVS